MLEPQRYTEWLHSEVFLPTVVVIGTETVKTRCREANRVSLGELFSPFGGFYRNIPVTYHSMEKRLHVENFRVRFADADASTQWTTAQAEKVAASMVEAASPKNPNEAMVHSPPGPWFEQWRLVMFKSLRWSEHEGLDQPVTALLVVSSKESDPVFLFEQLLHSSNMPPLCTQGVLDPVPARAAVILHDHSDPASPSLEELEAKLDLVRARFSPHLCLAVQINHGSEATQDVQDIFRHYVASRPSPPPPPPPDGSEPQICQYLSKEDLDALAHMASEVISRSAIPWMVQQLQQIENQISQTRKGFRNQLKYLWRKPREVGTKESAEEHRDPAALYPLQTTEGQMRLAGDLAFHLHDYDTALSYYRSVVSDFKQDKSWKHAAGAYEMWGVCDYILGSRTEAERCMENAYEHYLKATAGRHAMRAVILHLAMVGDYKEAATRLMKVNGDMSDTGLRSALILEQAAQLYGMANSERKCSFHMVLAGHTFNKLGFKRLALQCYSIVATRYRHKRWYHITDHFNFTMARQAFSLGFLPESMGHFVALLNSFTVNDKSTSIQPDRESTYLKEFLFVVRNWMEKCAPPDDEKIVDLIIPTINPSILVILPNDSRDGSLPASTVEDNPTSKIVPWETLGDKLVKALAIDDRKELQWRNRHDEKVFDSLQRTTAVDSAVHVEIVLSNPMRVELKLSNLRLDGELVEPTKEEQTAVDSLGREQSDSCAIPEEARSPVEFFAENIALGPLESKKLQLKALPKREGLLKIQKVSWSLFDQVLCSRPLHIKGRRLRDVRGQRSSDQPSSEPKYSDDKRLELRVCAKIPQMRAYFEGWPKSGEAPLLLGELRSCVLVVEASREGAGSAKSLRICCSHPAFMVCFASSAPQSHTNFTSYENGVLEYTGGLDSVLRVPITLRADTVGRHVIRTCILAEAGPDENTPKSELRQWITLQEQLTVQPSLSCIVSPSPSLQDTSRFIFSLAMENKSVNSLEICRVRCISGDQELALEESVKNGSARHLAGPGQLVHLIFTIPKGALAEEGSRPEHPRERMMLLRASREANLPPEKEGRLKKAVAIEERVDVVVEWDTGNGHMGEVYSLRVPYESPPNAAAPCPLALHLLAAHSAVLVPNLVVPVTLCMRNMSNIADVSFYFEAQPTPDILWLGCERSEVIRLAPQASHTAQLHALFCCPGVFNLNRFRLHVVGSGGSSSDASTAFALPVERLIHIKESE